MSDTTIHAPEGVELGLVVYLTSDSQQLDVTFKVSGLPYLEPFRPDFDAVAFSKGSDPALLLADDWRPMTREEVAAYRRAEAGRAEEGG